MAYSNENNSKSLSNDNISSWSVAFKGEHTSEGNKHSLPNLVQSQRIYTNIGVDTWLVHMTKLQTEIQITGDRDHVLSIFCALVPSLINFLKVL